MCEFVYKDSVRLCLMLSVFIFFYYIEVLVVI